MVDADLEHAYMPSIWNHQHLSPDEVLAKHFAIVAAESEKARQELTVISDIRYGTTPKNSMDLYCSGPTVKAGGVLFAYVHGGYWQALTKEDSAYFARTICKSVENSVFVAVDYVLATETVYGSEAKMKSIWEQMTPAYAALRDVADRLDCSGIFLCGHSAGAHLVTAMLSGAFEPSQRKSLFRKLKGLWLLSGVYDLVPISKTSVNDPLQLSKEEIQDCSPHNRVADIVHNLGATTSCSVKIMYGEFDPPAFHKQSQNFFEEVNNYVQTQPDYVHIRIKPPVEVKDRDHFDLVDYTVLEENYVLTDVVEVLKRHLQESQTFRFTEGVEGVETVDIKDVLVDFKVK
ncbi:kynurenine formamidase-like [Paramacrobiotus metropolitanus]|uniref:kynurenine formamidase-like n=1 Tax=Paramacrobiotus metropolitanus TaxID=2943436 RepID=UPI002446461F|nr:kynurenine formamidase-like [Paramacrobiotus metropolitanus]